MSLFIWFVSLKPSGKRVPLRPTVVDLQIQQKYTMLTEVPCPPASSVTPATTHYLRGTGLRYDLSKKQSKAVVLNTQAQEIINYFCIYYPSPNNLLFKKIFYFEKWLDSFSYRLSTEAMKPSKLHPSNVELLYLLFVVYFFRIYLGAERILTTLMLYSCCWRNVTRKLLIKLHMSTQWIHVLISYLQHKSSNPSPPACGKIVKRWILGTNINKYTVWNLCVQGDGCLIGPAASHVANGVTSSAQHEQRKVEGLNVLHTLCMA